MDSISVEPSWWEGNLSFDPRKEVIISVVAYEHVLGMPARICAGLIPAIDLVRQLKKQSVPSRVRLIDPSSIANYCNGWNIKNDSAHEVLGGFLQDHDINFFFDEAEEVRYASLEVLRTVSEKLVSSQDEKIIEMVQRIKESGRRHGGDHGEHHAVLYMSAHPFSWLDLHHQALWSRRFDPEEQSFVNLMSKPESRFTVVRKYLQNLLPDLSSGIAAEDRYMSICNTPCYIPLEGEPTMKDLKLYGFDWCLRVYKARKNLSRNHQRTLKDFETLVSFLQK